LIVVIRLHKVIRFLLFLVPVSGFAQGIPPIGEWREHLSFRKVFAVAQGPQKIYAATHSGFFSYDTRSAEIERFGKSTGLSGVDIVALCSDSASGHLLVAYANSDLDFVSGNEIRNINAIRLKSVPGSKRINRIQFVNGRFYVSTDFGIVVIDAVTGTLLDTYVVGRNGQFSGVLSVGATQGILYASTTEGLLRSSTASNLADYKSWQRVSFDKSIHAFASLTGRLFISTVDSLFELVNDTAQFVFSNGSSIIDITAGDGLLALSTSARVVLLRPSGAVASDLPFVAGKNGVAQALPFRSEVWVADTIAGLTRITNGNRQPIIPEGPSGDALGKIFVTPGVVLVASASNIAGDTLGASRDGFYKFRNNEWENFTPSNLPLLDTVTRIANVVSTPDGKTYAGSLGGGLIELSDRPRVYKQNSFVGGSFFSAGQYFVADQAVDAAGNLWFSNPGAAKELVVKIQAGPAFGFGYPFPIAGNVAGQIVTDDFNQVWLQAPFGNGLLCFNYGASIENAADDRWARYTVGAANGNLPSSDVRSLLKDRNGFIWVGTDKGIGIIQCPQQVFLSGSCPAVQPVVQQDNFAGYLFQNETVQCMQADGANRKWVGTKNGVWLVSEGGEKVIYRFTSSNSPLLSNDVRNIGIEPLTGEVFFGTAAGLCSFRSTATDAAADTVNSKVLVFPNPVPPGYTGTIAIRGVPKNAQIKITEMDGRILYQTRAVGGQAIWNGLDSRGRRASTGIYLVLVSNTDGKDAPATKIVFMKGSQR
jgi:Two component regulator propeller